MSDYPVTMFLIAVCALLVGILAGRCLDTPKTPPCDGQLVTGAIGTVEFRYCVHPTVAR